MLRGADRYAMTADDSALPHCDLTGATVTDARLTGCVRAAWIGADQLVTLGAALARRPRDRRHRARLTGRRTAARAGARRWFFADIDVDVRTLDGVGYFTPLEAAPEFAAAILDRLQEKP